MTKTTWTIDPAHSEVQFKVKHLVITTITGAFKEFYGTVVAGEDFKNAIIRFEASIHSISTNNEQRDTHLKSADFFEIEKYPKFFFDSTSFTKIGVDEYELKGNLTIIGITKPITLTAQYGGTMTDPWGNIKAGFELSGQINRKDFGLTWNATTEAGGILVGEEVKLLASIQLLKTIDAIVEA
ncbi:MAG TPA: YceI family protein [Chitinophagaceae bacterium]|nr:YceI family protein [Chitinophagaceae bacterium]